jgi:class 3 adenylate cyclase
MRDWIETADGRCIELESVCSFGRGQGNTVHLTSLAASRRHAYVHAQQSGDDVEYWLVDLGSTNGTLHNGRRVTLPCRLGDGDVISIFDDRFVFRSDRTYLARASTESTTIRVKHTDMCWMLIADIKGFTRLSRELHTDALGTMVGRWFSRCREVIQNADGTIDKLLGDGFLAYWRHDNEAATCVSQALAGLAGVRSPSVPDFRTALHLGGVLLHGSGGGANSISGTEVIYLFRMERLAAALGVNAIVSDAARAALPEQWRGASIGSHALSGFPGEHPMFGSS